MKTKKFSKKLTLNRSTVANLNGKLLSRIVGGKPPTTTCYDTNAPTCETCMSDEPGCTNEATCNPCTTIYSMNTRPC